MAVDTSLCEGDLELDRYNRERVFRGVETKTKKRKNING